MPDKKETELPKKRGRPATTPEARENQVISRAIDLAEKQIMDGTASSQVITHFLKLGSTKEKIEKDILKTQRDYLIAKTEAMKSGKNSEVLYAKALQAMKTYVGKSDSDEDLDD